MDILILVLLDMVAIGLVMKLLWMAQDTRKAIGGISNTSQTYSNNPQETKENMAYIQRMKSMEFGILMKTN
ncbi:MAG: hypothetical protein LUO80_04665 [Methylococcaceae bacterium]|nr:hypothetical protein [Methylococcaceae bacterium]